MFDNTADGQADFIQQALRTIIRDMPLEEKSLVKA